MDDALTPTLPDLPKTITELLARLAIQEETTKQLAGLAQDLCATVIALKAFANAAALSHPHPDRLLSVFQDHMDYAADALKPDQIAIYRNDMQQLQSAILLAVQRHDGKLP